MIEGPSISKEVVFWYFFEQERKKELELKTEGTKQIGKIFRPYLYEKEYGGNQDEADHSQQMAHRCWRLLLSVEAQSAVDLWTKEVCAQSKL
ncbi:MAG: hypothetical protein K0R47_3220 [Brevibacillus sp.]|jgi:hypothetical protein|nr:hypothetical protein [Brevibacillus sp.]